MSRVTSTSTTKRTVVVSSSSSASPAKPTTPTSPTPASPSASKPATPSGVSVTVKSPASPTTKSPPSSATPAGRTPAAAAAKTPTSPTTKSPAPAAAAPAAAPHGRVSVVNKPAVAETVPELEAGSRYQQGWARGGEEGGPAVSGFSSKNVVKLGGKNYAELKAKCHQAGALYEDPDFPAVDASLFPKQMPQGMPKIIWKRPPEIVKDAKMFVGGASRFDIKQGILGDCWLLASVASLCQNESLLHNVAPTDQDFSDKDYCGIFRFRFWRYGRWTEVIIDDRLPTCEGYENPLVFLRSQTNNEFWTPLLEKAYAKIFGCYEALKGGNTAEAMEDFTGGITESVDFRKKDKVPADLHMWISHALGRGSLLGCGIDPIPGRVEAELANGLICGHAYSVTGATTVDVVQNGKQHKIKMIRARNPWGNEKEWNGAWSDKSPEWSLIPENQKKAMGLSFDGDGEFWMSYDDFTTNFHTIEICHVPQTEEERKTLTKTFECVTFEGSWKVNVNAGGCINFRDTTFPTNPQYQFEIEDDKTTQVEDKYTVVIGLMQKEMRKKKYSGGKAPSIGYTIYKMPENQTGTLDVKFFRYNATACPSPSFINSRETCGRHELPCGKYCIIPSTFNQNEEADFLLRIFCEKAITSKEVDEQTTVNVSKQEDGRAKAAASDSEVEEVRVFYNKIVGADEEMNVMKLKDALNTTFKKDLKFDGFSFDTCKSLLATMDLDKSGMLGFDEFKTLWLDVRNWKNVFLQFDEDKSGNFNTYEMREALRSAGYSVSNATFNALAMRYSDVDGKVYFDNFVACVARLKTMFDVFSEMRRPDNTAVFSMDQFIQTTMYS